MIAVAIIALAAPFVYKGLDRMAKAEDQAGFLQLAGAPEKVGWGDALIPLPDPGNLSPSRGSSRLDREVRSSEVTALLFRLDEGDPASFAQRFDMRA